MTIGEGGVNRYNVIHHGTKAFESRNHGALFVATSQAKSTGKNNSDPNSALHGIPLSWQMQRGYAIKKHQQQLLERKKFIELRQ